MGVATAIRRLLDHTRDLDDPALNGRAIQPDDDNDLRDPTRGLYIGAPGNITLILWEDTEPVTFENMVAGVVHPLAVKRVLESGTTAQAIVGLF